MGFCRGRIGHKKKRREPDAWHKALFGNSPGHFFHAIRKFARIALPVPYLDLPTIVDLEYGGQASPQKIAVYKIVIGLYGIEVIPDNLLIDGSVVIVP